jgi:hypothetical protein
MTKRILFAVSILPLFTSCITANRDKLKIGTCISETNKRYVASARGAIKVYRINQILKNHLNISVWSNKNWFYRGEKRNTYFSENKTFAYEKVTCPDGTTNAGLTARLKTIDI